MLDKENGTEETNKNIQNNIKKAITLYNSKSLTRKEQDKQWRENTLNFKLREQKEQMEHRHREEIKRIQETYETKIKNIVSKHKATLHRLNINTLPYCSVCKKPGHTTNQCYWNPQSINFKATTTKIYKRHEKTEIDINTQTEH